MAASDPFGPRAQSYAVFRPDYPPALLDFVASLPKERRLAWDCATGNGQAAVALAERFQEVIATDRSQGQLGQAKPHPRVTYRLTPAEASGLPDASVDLVAVAQALHWFDLPRFYAEVVRVLVPGGALAVWSYGDPVLEDPRLTASLRRFDRQTLDRFWLPGREHVRDGYRNLPFPFPEAPGASFTLLRRWELGEILGYLRSWSAVAACVAATGTDPVLEMEAELAPAWGPPETKRLVRWPLTLRAGVRP
jgi:SAM-dependent methyltransferase